MLEKNAWQENWDDAPSVSIFTVMVEGTLSLTNCFMSCDLAVSSAQNLRRTEHKTYFTRALIPIEPPMTPNAEARKRITAVRANIDIAGVVRRLRLQQRGERRWWQLERKRHSRAARSP